MKRHIDRLATRPALDQKLSPLPMTGAFCQNIKKSADLQRALAKWVKNTMDSVRHCEISLMARLRVPKVRRCLQNSTSVARQLLVLMDSDTQLDFRNEDICQQLQMDTVTCGTLIMGLNLEQVPCTFLIGSKKTGETFESGLWAP